MKTLLCASMLAVAAASHALDLKITLSSSVDLSNAVFAYKSTTSNDEGGAPLGNIVAGTYSGSASVNGSLSDYDAYRYTLMSTYVSPTDGHTGVVIALNPDSTAMATGTSFESMFGTSESTIVNALQGLYSSNPLTQFFSYNTLTSFAEANMAKLPAGAGGGSLVAFSNGTLVGNMNAAPVPEPATLTALGLGAVAILRRHRKA